MSADDRVNLFVFTAEYSTPFVFKEILEILFVNSTGWSVDTEMESITFSRENTFHFLM